MWKTALTLIFIVALTGCDKPAPGNAGQSDGGYAQKITVAYTWQPENTLVHVAVAKGYFAKEGLIAQFSMHTYGKAALQAVLDKQADFATVAETPFMFSVLRGEKIFVIANIESSSTNHAVVARKDAGIAVPGDLKGKRIGFTPGTTSDFFLDSLLTANGLTRQEIQPVPLKPEDMQEAIMAAKVDALSAWNYPLTQIRNQLGAGGIVFYDRHIYTETFNIAAQQEFVHNHPEAVKRFLRALLKAEDFVAKNPDEAQTIVSAATKIDKSLVSEVWNNFNYQVKLDQTLLITLDDEARWAIRNKLTEQTVMPDFASYIHADSLKAIKPEAVRSLR
ncbi:ABC transporter substrate-binding protein [Propionivibrio sp.]|uniref:ABC transporter substrate-binding protein n=1 Tax=Propionivibrio sp. TaxID=2212460 RepID=UPI003BF28DE4